MTDKIKIGETRFGEGPYTIDDVTNNAVIILKVKSRLEIAAMNFDIMDSPKAYELIQPFVEKFISQFSCEDEVGTNNIEAVIVGGQYREHKHVDEGMFVYTEYNIARRKAEEALRICNLDVEYIATDERSTKHIDIGKYGNIACIESRTGHNIHDAIISLEDYEMTIKNKNY